MPRQEGYRTTASEVPFSDVLTVLRLRSRRRHAAAMDRLKQKMNSIGPQASSLMFLPALRASASPIIESMRMT
ncbi:hypothetical protein CO683_41095 [Bradyrhizobium ottawaense]|nr:hypothetical protein CO683_41095 [Bradyrhizobium ottawaense]